MEKVIKISGDRVLIEENGQYFEKEIDTIEKQQERQKQLDSIRDRFGCAKPD